MPKLTAKQKAAQLAREKELKFLQQQNSVQILSQPSERSIKEAKDNELYNEMIGDKKANDGLHLASEHVVITRDQPDPALIGNMARVKHQKSQKKEEQKDPQGWEVLTEEESGPESKLDSLSDSKKKDGDSRSNSPQKKNPSKNPIDNIPIKQFSQRSNSKKASGKNMSGVWQEHQQVDITNYQQSQLKQTDSSKNEGFIKRMQNSVSNKDRKTKNNKDLEIQTQTNIGSKNEKQSVGFTDSMSAKNKTVTSLNAKGPTAGILKTSNLNSMNNTQNLKSVGRNTSGGNFNTISAAVVNENKTEGSNKSPDKNMAEILQRRKSKEEEFWDIDEGLLTGSSFRRKQKGKKNVSNNEDGYWYEQDEIVPDNSQWAGLTQLPGSGLALGGPGFKPGDLTLPDSEIEAAITRKNMVLGIIPMRKKGKLCWQNVNPSIYESQQAVIEATMQDMVYNYTRKIKKHEDKYEKIAQERLQKELEQMDEKDFFENGISNAQDKKLQRIKRKLNQSVDYAEIKAREIERSKNKYHEYPIYKKITEKMTFKDEEYLKYMDSSTDPKLSPLTPAQFVTTVKEENVDKDVDTKKVDIYSPDIPALDNFATINNDSYDPLIKDDRFSTIQLDSKQDDSLYSKKKKKRERKQSEKPSTPKTMRGGTEQVIPELSQESGGVKSNTDNHSRSQSRQNSQTYQNSSEKRSDQDDEYDDDMFENPLDEVNLEIYHGDKQKEEPKDFKYSIRNRSKKDAKAKMSAMEKFASDIEKPKGPEETWQDNKKQMMETEKVFKIVHEYCKDHLNVSYNMINKTIQDLLKPNTDVSPLLKFFDLIAKNSNFRMPNKALLEFDQKFYRAFIARLQEGQKVEIKWVKNTVIHESRKTCMKAFDQARTLMQKEIKDILFNFDNLKAKLDETVEENFRLKKVIESQQLELSDMKVYIKQTICKLFEDDEELFYLNGGPGGAHDKFIYGDVIQSIDQYHRNLRDECTEKVEDIQRHVEDKVLEEILKSANFLDLTGGQQSPNPSIISSAASPALSIGFQKSATIRRPKIQHSARDLNIGKATVELDGQTSPLIKKTTLDYKSKEQVAQFKGAVKTHVEKAIEMHANFKEICDSKDDLLHQLEPFLKKPMKLFGGYVSLTMQDAQTCMDQEMYKYQVMQYKKLEKKNEALKAENFAEAVMMEELRKRNDLLQIENDKFHEKLNDMKRQFEAETNKIKYESDVKMKEMKERCDRQMRQARKLMSHEVEICTQIKDKMLNENLQMAAKLKKFATIIKIPRLHFEYIEKHGVNEFVTYCEDIVKRERSLIELKEAQKKQVQLRNELSIQAIKKIQGPIEERVKTKKLDMTINQPFKLTVSAQKDLQENGRFTAKDKENAAILKHLNEINWIKNKSILDMTELMEKNLDRQPELLAMMQPDLKSHLLNNPALLKSVEQLEKMDPINKKTKTVRNYLEKIKSETFGNFNDDNLQKASNKDLIKFKRNMMNKSMDLDKQFPLNMNEQHHTIDHNYRLENSKRLHIRSSSFARSDSKNSGNDGTIIVQVNSNNNDSSQKLLQSISGSNVNPIPEQSIMLGIGNSELDMVKDRDNQNELKDTVSGLPSLMTRVSTNINDIKRPVHSSSIDFASNNYGLMDRNAVSSRIVGLNQLNKSIKNMQHKQSNRYASPNPNDMLNNKSGISLNQSSQGKSKEIVQNISKTNNISQELDPTSINISSVRLESDQEKDNKQQKVKIEQ